MMEVIEFCISPGAVDVGDSLIGVLPDFLSFSQSLSSPVSRIAGLLLLYCSQDKWQWQQEPWSPFFAPMGKKNLAS